MRQREKKQLRNSSDGNCGGDGEERGTRSGNRQTTAATQRNEYALGPSVCMFVCAVCVGVCELGEGIGL